MNEKFNEAEVWDHLSKGKRLVEYEEKDIVSREEDDLCFQENGDQHCDGKAYGVHCDGKWSHFGDWSRKS